MKRAEKRERQVRRVSVDVSRAMDGGGHARARADLTVVVMAQCWPTIDDMTGLP